jgi:hypothetical protein
MANSRNSQLIRLKPIAIRIMARKNSRRVEAIRYLERPIQREPGKALNSKLGQRARLEEPELNS